jgi:hypothetical protein
LTAVAVTEDRRGKSHCVGKAITTKEADQDNYD